MPEQELRRFLSRATPSLPGLAQRAGTQRAAGVYTVWDGDLLLSVGMSGRAMVAEDLEVGAVRDVASARRDEVMLVVA